MPNFQLKRGDIGEDLDALILLKGTTTPRDLTGLTVHMKVWENETDPDDPANVILDVAMLTPGPEVNRVRWTVSQADVDALEPTIGGSLEPTIFKAEYEFTRNSPPYRKSSNPFEIIVSRSP